jgi:hypothetical protein
LVFLKLFPQYSKNLPLRPTGFPTFIHREKHLPQPWETMVAHALQQDYFSSKISLVINTAKMFYTNKYTVLKPGGTIKLGTRGAENGI